MTKEERAIKLIAYFSGDWKNVPIDKVMEFVMEQSDLESLETIRALHADLVYLGQHVLMNDGVAKMGEHEFVEHVVEQLRVAGVKGDWDEVR